MNTQTYLKRFQLNWFQFCESKQNKIFYVL